MFPPKIPVTRNFIREERKKDRSVEKKGLSFTSLLSACAKV